MLLTRKPKPGCQLPDKGIMESFSLYQMPSINYCRNTIFVFSQRRLINGIPNEFNRLLEYQKENGAKSRPSSGGRKGNKYTSLYQWCKNQKSSARKNTLSEEKFDKLKSVLGNWLDL